MIIDIELGFGKREMENAKWFPAYIQVLDPDELEEETDIGKKNLQLSQEIHSFLTETDDVDDAAK